MDRGLGVVGGLLLIFAGGGRTGYSFSGTLGSWLAFVGPAVCAIVPVLLGVILPGRMGGWVSSLSRVISSGPVSAFGS